MNLIPRSFFFNDDFEDFIPNLKGNMKCDIYENTDNLFIEMDLPGLSKSDINIDVENKYLNISVSKEEKNDSEKVNYIRRERSYNKMSRSFYIGEVDESLIKAELNNGVLKVVIPKIKFSNEKKNIQID